MNTSRQPDARVRHVDIDGMYLSVALMDGRIIRTPLAWYPRLPSADPQQLAQWEIVGAGSGLHWAGLDEDLSVQGMLRGHPASGFPLQRDGATI
ncbi:MAG: DUF2442 domain-containing protein [Sphingomonadaceae bacterium]